MQKLFCFLPVNNFFVSATKKIRWKISCSIVKLWVFCNKYLAFKVLLHFRLQKCWGFSWFLSSNNFLTRIKYTWKTCKQFMDVLSIPAHYTQDDADNILYGLFAEYTARVVKWIYTHMCLKKKNSHLSDRLHVIIILRIVLIARIHITVYALPFRIIIHRRTYKATLRRS